MKLSTILIILTVLSIPFLSYAQWETERLPDGRSEISSVSIGDNIYFVGGATSGIQRYFKMNIYNVPTKNWTTVDVPNGTKGPRTIAIDKKIYFGDIEGDRTIYIYDTVTETWDEIDVPGYIGTMTYMDNMIIIEDNGDLMIYDLDAEDWTEFDFDNNSYATVTATNGKIAIAGGSPNIVRIYDLESNSWMEGELSVERDDPRAISYGNRMFFIGGEADGFGWTGRIDIFDTENNTWSIDSLSTARNRFDVTVHDEKLIIAGGQRISFSNQWRKEMDIFDLSTNVWETVEIPTGRRYPSVIGHNNKLYIAGGDADESNLDIIEIYSLTTTNTKELNESSFIAYPNPAINELRIKTNIELKNVTVIDLFGRVHGIPHDQLDNNYLDVSKLRTGVYFIKINDSNDYLRFVKN